MRLHRANEVHCFLLCLEGALEKLFNPIEIEQNDNKWKILVCYRKDHSPTLFIRTAR